MPFKHLHRISAASSFVVNQNAFCYGAPALPVKYGSYIAYTRVPDFPLEFIRNVTDHCLWCTFSFRRKIIAAAPHAYGLLPAKQLLAQDLESSGKRASVAIIAQLGLG
ncbi:hypothetical protein VTO73DRAFT_2152 [Trametes versicolor]